MKRPTTDIPMLNDRQSVPRTVKSSSDSRLAWIHRILVIASDHDTRDTFARVLRRLGSAVRTAASGRSGLRFAKRMQFDVVVADLYTDDISGLEVFATLRNSRITTAFVVVTSWGSVRSAVQAMHLGACDYVEKPISEVDIIQIMNRVSRLREFAVQIPPEPHQAPAPVVMHAAHRWAQIVAPVVTSASDLKTIGEWSRYIGASPGSITSRCRAVGTTPRRSLMLVRLLRAVLLRRTHNIPVQESLNVVDKRTLVRMLEACRSRPLLGGDELPADIPTLLTTQPLVTNEAALRELRSSLAMDTRQN